MNVIAWINDHPLLAFFALSFSWAWGIWVPVGLLAPELLLAFVLPGAWAPTLTAVFLTGLSGGRNDLRCFRGRLLRWRIPVLWYAVPLLLIPVTALTALGVHVVLGGKAAGLSFPPGVPPDIGPAVLPLLFLVNIFAGGPLAEELGWRGFAQPRLQEHIGALPASLLIGAVWGLWHLPFFWFGETAGSVVGGIPFVWFVQLTIGWSVLFAWVYNSSGSLLLPVMFHSAANTTLGSLGILGNPEAELRPLVLYIGLTWITVAVVALVFGPRRLSRTPQER